MKRAYPESIINSVVMQVVFPDILKQTSPKTKLNLITYFPQLTVSSDVGINLFSNAEESLNTDGGLYKV